MRAAIYARKSTEQTGVADEAKSVVRQITGARAFISARHWTLDETHVYTDDGVSGALFANRVEFSRMMRDAEAHALDGIVLFDLDRFGRDSRQTMNFLHRLADLNVEVWDYSREARVDLESFEGETVTFLNARFAQQFREQIRKHTIRAMRAKAEQGFVTGGVVFGYDNVRIAKGHVERRINDDQAAIVREIFARFAEGVGLRSIALGLNQRHVPSPRAQQGRRAGWSSSTVRAVLARPLYRGIVEYGRTKKAYGREVTRSGRTGEKKQIPAAADALIRLDAPQLRIVEADVAARVDARRRVWTERPAGKMPQRANERSAFLLSGLLRCPDCGGNFEAYTSPWNGGVYVCATRRRKPGTCTNTWKLKIAELDEVVLSVVEGEVLGTAMIEELCAYVESVPDPTAHLTAERDRLKLEISRLVALVAAGVPAATVANEIQTRDAEVSRIEAQLTQPRPAKPDTATLRSALEQRTADWRAQLRHEHPRVARLLLRRLVGPLTLSKEPQAGLPNTTTLLVEEDLFWSGKAKPAELLKDLTNTSLASPTGFEPVFWP
jgi:site-specific DNA recombinase